jgi:aminotransferase EvaB
MSSPLLTADPKAGYLAHAEEIRAAIDRVLAGGHYILGPEVEAFEREFAADHGGGEVVGAANGTDALELALRAVGIKAGDTVATVANTVTATVSAIEQIGARPVFVEIEAGTMLMSPAALESLLATRPGGVQAVVPVHLYGQPATMPAISELARRHGVKVVEDCAQSHGAKVAPGVRRPPTAIIQPKISAPWGMAGRCSPATPPSPRGCGCSASMAGGSGM